ncbi:MULTISPECIES: hypothetical protein [Catellatospora]|uniref:Beta-lactamase enzyme family protein n=1 Tax=Catellatospora chokoriensis TaxID=310353 RepID=A0A8J3K084_9ACTN|nr:hypothetical protein [Catellatospora chokoriensis]GIF90556.1 hypothetical protein Cch02nite_40000 [Catellatospora chokoriensis]
MTELFTRRRALLTGAAGLAALAGGGFWLAGRGSGDPAVAASWQDPAASPSAAASPESAVARSMPVQPGPPGVEQGAVDVLAAPNPGALVSVQTSAWWSWALMDRKTGKIVGSSNFNQTNMTASMIKAWLAADYLRRAAEAGQTPSTTRMNEIRTMIRDSANGPASTLYEELGRSATIARLIDVCGLTDSKAGDGWSTTRLSARDTCRIAHAIGSGKAAGPTWTSYLVGEMRAVRGTGNFGIRKAFPAAEQSRIAIKNGWVDRQATKEWNVNCMALGDDWTMAVLTRFPLSTAWTHGGEIAKSVATQLRTKTELV